jgi:hypothetical protein
MEGSGKASRTKGGKPGHFAGNDILLLREIKVQSSEFSFLFYVLIFSEDFISIRRRTRVAASLLSSFSTYQHSLNYIVA